MVANAADRLIAKIEEFDAPVCVGLDPFVEMIPDSIKDAALSEFGNTTEAVCAAIASFNKEIISATEDLVGIYKPQVAFYEQYGFAGLQAFSETVALLKKKDKVVIADAKRGDIGSTASAYADEFLGEVPLISGHTTVFDTDYLTVNGYLGWDGIKPFVERAKGKQKGIFVLAKTSNPSSGDLQDLTLSTGEQVYIKMSDLITAWGEGTEGERGYSSVGAVVGTTYPHEASIIRARCPKCLFLVPGYGAQGATGKDVVTCFNANGTGAVVNSSRQILYAYRSSNRREMDFRDAARFAAIEMITDIRGALKECRLGK